MNNNPNIEVINFANSNLRSIPEEIFSHLNLRILILSSNLISELPKEIGNLSRLECLDLSDNKIESVPKEISKLKNLKCLYLNNNKLKKADSFLWELCNLESLVLSNNSIERFEPGIENLENLQELYLRNNKISEFPEDICRALNLSKLFLGNNELTQIPKKIALLKNLEILNISNCKVKILPDTLCELHKLTKLVVLNNPLISPPYEFANSENNIDQIKYYFRELSDSGIEFIYEAKLIIVGEPGAGKTSLSKKLIDPAYELCPTEQMTMGVEIFKNRFLFKQDVEFQTNIWDFGGQQIMHATHKYFLTKRSLYIVMADNREENTDFYYWINLISLLSKNCPIMIVLNEKYDYKKHFSSDLMSSFSCIEDVYTVNLSNNRGLTSLSKKIKSCITNLPHVGKEPIPSNWKIIRSKIEQLPTGTYYINTEKFYTICKECGVYEKNKMDHISDFLHDLGVILHYQEDRLLKDIVILDPVWATEAVYLLLFDRAIIDKYGHFNNLDIERIWATKKYQGKHSHLLQLMIKFELCYEISQSQEYIIPELLPQKKQKTTENVFSSIFPKDLLQFQYIYNFMPKGIIPRIIVRLHQNIYSQSQWKDCAIFKFEDSYAEVKEDFRNNAIKIKISGNQKNYALSIIRESIKQINKQYESLVFNEMVPCNCNDCQDDDVPHFFKYELLKRYERKGLPNIRCEKSLEEVDVLRLTNDLIVAYRIKQKLYKENGNIYAHELHIGDNIKMDSLKNYRTQVSGNIIHGDLAIADIINESYNKINHLPIDDTLKDYLKQLNENIALLCKNLPDEKVEDLIDDYERFTKEVTKEKPKKKWYELSADGLMSAAKSVGELGKPIIDLIKNILNILE
jgi:internalin A